MKTILFINHGSKQCGIYQYGINIFAALKNSTKYRFVYKECFNPTDLKLATLENAPAAIIYNYYRATLLWISQDLIKEVGVKSYGIFHECTQEITDKFTGSSGFWQDIFDYNLCPDPTLKNTNPIVYSIARYLLPYSKEFPYPEVPTFGSFGFGFNDKGFEDVITLVQGEYDRAIINIHMPFNSVVDPNGAYYGRATEKRCRDLVSKPGIVLNITHNFLSNDEVLDFLAKNTANIFLYKPTKFLGISSIPDYALAVNRPLIVRKCNMFRHLECASPSIAIDDLSLREIINNGTDPIKPFREVWSEGSFINSVEYVLNKTL